MKRLFILSVMLLLSNITFSQSNGNGKPEMEINKVINSFMQSIIKKDSSTFLQLFAQNQVGWSSVTEAKSYESMKKTSPNASILYNGNHKSFIRWIVNNKESLEEKFYNIKIRTDNCLASVSFDYGFFSSGKQKNWGQEDWELVYNGTDWKIIGVYWSQNNQAITPEPKWHH